jgi:hypothetical protein
MISTKPPALMLSALLTLCAALSGCATAPSPPKGSPSLNLYQPPVLRLQAGQPVPTKDGIYTPQADEIWHGAADYRHANDQIEALTHALAQLRNAPRP